MCCSPATSDTRGTFNAGIGDSTEPRLTSAISQDADPTRPPPRGLRARTSLTLITWVVAPPACLRVAERRSSMLLSSRYIIRKLPPWNTSLHSLYPLAAHTFSRAPRQGCPSHLAIYNRPISTMSMPQTKLADRQVGQMGRVKPVPVHSARSCQIRAHAADVGA